MAEMTKSYLEDILNVSKVNLPWKDLSGCKILVTGATGLIGSCLVETLMFNPQRDYQIYALGRNFDRAQIRFKNFLNDADFHFLQHDIMNPLKGSERFDYIIHAASNASPNFFINNPVEVIKSNIEGVSNLLEYGIQHGMKRFLYVSSGEVYGEGDGRVFTEDYSGYVDCTSTRACYPSSKRAAETLCVSYAAEYGADVVIARPCHVYGPYFTESDNRVYAQFIRNVLNGDDIVMKSTGDQFRSWCYVVDCVSALLHILLKGESCEAYNIADERANLTIRDLADMIAESGGRNVKIDLSDSTERKGYNVVQKSVFSIEKIKQLGWSPVGIMKEKIKRTIREERNCNHHS